ncbi:twin-arginine translocase TatA/TatE family subunit [Streptomyces sp. TG1A-60]|uniref:twin-arginine translocase TatA/TatE family subunit n=1 Tax=Streptomyces sp. TG1A-60 TaxID=3129111 RepID=UPI0030CC61C3
MFGLSELAVILIVVIAVLAAKKLPDLARSAGKSARILKAEARAMNNDETQADAAPQAVPGETTISVGGAAGTSEQDGRPPQNTPTTAGTRSTPAPPE